MQTQLTTINGMPWIRLWRPACSSLPLIDFRRTQPFYLNGHSLPPFSMADNSPGDCASVTRMQYRRDELVFLLLELIPLQTRQHRSEQRRDSKIRTQEAVDVIIGLFEGRLCLTGLFTHHDLSDRMIKLCHRAIIALPKPLRQTYKRLYPLTKSMSSH